MSKEKLPGKFSSTPPPPPSKLNVMNVENNGYLCFKNDVEWHWVVFTNSSPVFWSLPLPPTSSCYHIFPLIVFLSIDISYFPVFYILFFFKSYINHIWNISHLIEFILFFEYSYLHYYRIITIFLVLMKSFQLRKTFIVNL